MTNETIQLTNSYWGLLKSLSNEVKLRLAARLTASIIETENDTAVNHTEEMIHKYCGAWKDNRSSDEIAEDIRLARTGCKSPLNL